MNPKVLKTRIICVCYIILSLCVLAEDVHLFIIFLRDWELPLFFYKVLIGQYISLKDLLRVIGSLLAFGCVTVIFSYVAFYFLYALIISREHVLKTIEDFSETEALTVFQGYEGREKEGPYQTYYPNSLVMYEQNYKKGKLHGVCCQFYQTGRLLLEVHCKDDKLEGEAKQRHEDGGLWKMMYYKNDLLHGDKRIYNKEKRLCFFAKYEKGKYQGVKRTYYAKGQKESSYQYEAGALSGVSERYYANGTRAEEHSWRNGNGTVKVYYKNGKLKEKHLWENRSGRVLMYYENGALQAEQSWVKDVPAGVWKEYYEKGALKREQLWSRWSWKDKGLKRVHEQDGYYEQGALAREGPFWEEISDRMISDKEYYETGTLKSEKLFKGSRIIKQNAYNKSGDLTLSGSHK